LGVILFILLSGYHPFDPEGLADDEQLAKQIVVGNAHWEEESWRHVSAEARQVVTGLLQSDPQRRTTVSGLLADPWVSGGTAPIAPLPGSDTNLKAFNEYRKVWRAAIRAAGLISRTHEDKSKLGSAPNVSDLTDGAREELRAAFNVYDRDGNGSIDLNELRLVMREMGAKEADAETAMAAADTARNGVISFDEFCVVCGPLYSSSEHALRSAFALFDTDGNGTIDRAELGGMLSKLGLIGQESNKQTVERMFAAADTNGDGEISFDEFVGLFAADNKS